MVVWWSWLVDFGIAFVGKELVVFVEIFLIGPLLLCGLLGIDVR